MNGMLKSISRPKIAAPGEAFNTVWYVERIAHAAAYGYFVLLAVCSPICSVKFGFFCQAEHMNG